MTRVLVTGAGGYIGGRLVQALEAAGFPVRAAGLRAGVAPTGDQIALNLAGDPRAVDAACDGVSTIVHLAGANEVLAAREPAVAFASTTVATLQLAQAAMKAGVQRIVYLSTVHVYGTRMTENAVLREDLRPEPISVYAIARLASERLLVGLVEGEADVVVLRLTNSVGAPVTPAVDRWSLVANDLCRQGATTGRLELKSAGVQWRDFVALSDVCATITAACAPDRVPSGLYNLGLGQSMTIRMLAEMIQDGFERLTGDRPPLLAPPAPPHRPEPFEVSTERLAGLGLAVQTSIRDAVEETVSFCLYHRERL